MKVVAISDMHGLLPDIPPCDLLLIAGDICPVKNHEIAFQAAWLDTTFRQWLDSLRQVGRVIGVAGNHDFLFEKAPELVPTGLSWVYLQDRGTEYAGLHIWGTPWQPWFFDWAFNGQPEQLKQQWALIPKTTDILVVHGPPRGYGDGVPESNGTTRLCGCPHLLERIEEVQPRLVVFGHIHPGAGVYAHKGTTLANVSLLDDSYRGVHGPSVFLLDADKRQTIVCAAPGLPPGERRDIPWA